MILLLALKQGKVYVPSETNRDYTTVVEAVSGRGLSVPPLVILKGREHLARWYTNEVGLETDFLIALSVKVDTPMIDCTSNGSTIFIVTVYSH